MGLHRLVFTQDYVYNVQFLNLPLDQVQVALQQQAGEAGEGGEAGVLGDKRGGVGRGQEEEEQ